MAIDSGQQRRTAARFEQLVAAVPAEVPRLRQALTRWAQELGLTDEQRHAVRLAVSEALTNAVVHAFIDRPPGTMRLVAEPRPGHLEVRVIDDGRGLGPRPDSPGLGMGVPMIGKLCSSVDFSPGPDGTGTEVRMQFAAPALVAPPTAQTDLLPEILAALGDIAAGDAFTGDGIAALPGLLVPRLADLCSVTLLEADGAGRRVGARVAHPDGTPDPEATAWVMSFPVSAKASPSLVAASTGQTRIHTVDASFAQAISPDPERARALLALGLAWWAAVPLRSAGRAVGSIAVAGRRGGPGTVVAAVERIAEHAGGLVATARLVEDLRRTQRRLQHILGALTEAVTVTGPDGRVVYANPAAVALLGAAGPDELLQAAPGEPARRFLVTGEDGEPVPEEALPAHRVRAGLGAPPLLTRSVDRISGRTRWLRTTSSRLAEEPLVVDVMQDVTAVKEAELRQSLLARAGEILAAGPADAGTFGRIAGLSVPTVADGCVAELAGEDGAFSVVAVHHVDPGRRDALERRPPPDRRDPRRATVPVRLHGRTLGRLTLVDDVSGRVFSAASLAAAGELAQRAAAAIESAWLHAQNAQAQSELQASLGRLQLLADAGFGGLIRGVEDRIVEANATFLRMLRHERVEDLPPWPQMTPPEWAATDARALAQMRATGRSELFEKECVRRDGTRVRVMIGAVVSDPERFEWVGVVVDVSDRHVQDARARAGLDRLTLGLPREDDRDEVADVMSGLATAVLIQRPGKGIVYANQAAAEAMGMSSPAAVIAATPEQIASGWDTFEEDGTPLAPERYPSRRILEGEREVEPLIVRTVNRATGREYWRQIRARPVLDRDGGLSMTVSMTEDITEARRATLTQHLLAEAGRVLSSSMEYEQTLQGLARLAVPDLADWCSVAMPDEHGVIRTVAVAHTDPKRVDAAWAYVDRYAVDVSAEGGAAEILRGGPGVLTPEVPDELLREHIRDPEQLELLRGLGMRSVLQVPVVAAGSAPIGVLSLINAESGRVFGDADFRLAEELGRRAGTAVQNARLHADRSRIAATLQASLLPDALPRIPGYALASSYRPAGAENWVGGDFLDVFEVEGGWMLIVGDVAGHGAQAAALTAQARHTLRAIGEACGDPVRAVAHLNRLLLRTRPEPALVTVCAVALRERPAAGDVVADVVCAGHPLPYLRRGGRIRSVGRSSPLLGAWEAEFTAVEVPILPGDLLTIYTDGVLDARAGQEHFGDRRLAAVLAPATGAADAVRRLEQALDAFQTGAQADDTAVLAVERLATP